jgi:hypothetical protein
MMTTTRLADIQLWHRNLASLIRSGLFSRAEVVESNGLSTVVGVYADGTKSAPMAKYADARRAEDALGLVNKLVQGGGNAEAN